MRDELPSVDSIPIGDEVIKMITQDILDIELRLVLNVAQRITEKHVVPEEQLLTSARMILALDKWISEGGFLPSKWAGKEEARKASEQKRKIDELSVQQAVGEDYGRVPHERHIQEQILEWRATGASDEKIASDLNGNRWFARGGFHWTAAMVRKAYPPDRQEL